MGGCGRWGSDGGRHLRVVAKPYISKCTHEQNITTANTSLQQNAMNKGYLSLLEVYKMEMQVPRKPGFWDGQCLCTTCPLLRVVFITAFTVTCIVHTWHTCEYT